MSEHLSRYSGYQEITRGHCHRGTYYLIAKTLKVIKKENVFNLSNYTFSHKTSYFLSSIILSFKYASTALTNSGLSVKTFLKR